MMKHSESAGRNPNRSPSTTRPIVLGAAALAVASLLDVDVARAGKSRKHVENSEREVGTAPLGGTGEFGRIELEATRLKRAKQEEEELQWEQEIFQWMEGCGIPAQVRPAIIVLIFPETLQAPKKIPDKKNQPPNRPANPINLRRDQGPRVK